MQFQKWQWHFTYVFVCKIELFGFPWAVLYLSWGTSPPPSWTTVGKTSIRLVGSWITRPAGSTPGHRKIPGTRIPPSQPPIPLPPVCKHEQKRMWLCHVFFGSVFYNIWGTPNNDTSVVDRISVWVWCGHHGSHSPWMHCLTPESIAWRMHNQNVVHPYNGRLFSHGKEGSTNSCHMENIMLSEASHLLETTYCMIPLTWNGYNREIYRGWNKLVVTRGWAWGEPGNDCKRGPSFFFEGMTMFCK